MIVLMPLVLFAAPLVQETAMPTQRVVKLATATVTIIQAQRIKVTDTDQPKRQSDRQIRQREQKPIVEFF